MIDESIFRAYDIRGVYPSQINGEIAYKIGQAYAKLIGSKTVVIGRDVRTAGPVLFESLSRGLIDHGVNVIDIGVITTDMYYFAVAEYKFDGGIMISASHNPSEFNGFKMVKHNAMPISGDNGIPEIKELVLSGYRFQSKNKGVIKKQDVRDDYIKKCLSFIDKSKIKPLKAVVNAMFGPVYQNIIQSDLPIKLIPLNEIPDGTFPKGAPDPYLEENRRETSEFIRKSKADLGAAWDADADRFFLFDENGRYIPGYYLTAFLGCYFAKKQPESKIIYEPRAIWATIEEVEQKGGIPILNKVGHSFIKERMRSEDALFAGEGSGHYYFKDFYYADNGLIPFLILLEIISVSGKKVSEIFNRYFEKYYISEEINTELKSFDAAQSIFKVIESKYADAKLDHTDGVSIEYPAWRANIRFSNTQPLIRLNVEAKSKEILEQKTQELLYLIRV